jgi:C-terminal processing protease CtpA/Prc
MRAPLAALLLLLLLHGNSTAQPKQDAAIDAAARKSAVDGLADTLRKRYVFPAVAEKYAAAIQKKLAAGGYTQTQASAFVDALNADLQAVQKDGHLRVGFDPKFKRVPEVEPSPAEKADMKKRVEWMAYGLDKVQRLHGNVGLIELRNFLPKEHVANAFASAMSLVANTNALIIDLRQNGGGDPDTVALLVSYFVADGKKLHINDIYDRPTNKTTEFWSVPKLAGPRYPNRRIYVLTSKHTFSGAEEFAYNVQTHKLGTVIGETTGGGAHPGEVSPIGGGFVAFVPQGRAINPVTKTNWEGTGVKPDIATTADKAFQTAYVAALKAALPDERDPVMRGAMERALKEAEQPTTK